MSTIRKVNAAIEEAIEYSVFASRWVQAIVYSGLIVGAGFYSYKFLTELAVIGLSVDDLTEIQVMLAILGLIDISMVMNLLIIVIIGGYSIFTSRLDFEGKQDRPQWLDNLDADRLKVKLATSLASISGVHLLKSFIDVHSEVKTESMAALNFEIGIHMVFIASALVLAWIVKILSKDDEVIVTQKTSQTSRNLSEIISLVQSGKTATRSHIKNLIQIAAADGKFDAEERKVLASIAKMNHISLKQILRIQADSKVKFEIPSDPNERFYQLYDLIKVMSADHRIHPSEMRLCELFAIRFGYRKENIKELIEGIRLNIAQGNGPDETMIVLSGLVI